MIKAEKIIVGEQDYYTIHGNGIDFQILELGQGRKCIYRYEKVTI